MIGATYEVDDKISLSSQLQEVISSFSGANGQGTGGGGEGDDHVPQQHGDVSALGKADHRPEPQRRHRQAGQHWAADLRAGLAGRQLCADGEDRPLCAGRRRIPPVPRTWTAPRSTRSSARASAMPRLIRPPFSLNAAQSVHTDVNTTTGAGAAMLNQTVVSTDVGAEVTQRIAQRFFLSFAFQLHPQRQPGWHG